MYAFDVTVSTHDLLRRGITAGRLAGETITHHRVIVSDEFTPAEAEIVAAQIRAVTSGAMPTAVMPRF